MSGPGLESSMAAPELSPASRDGFEEQPFNGAAPPGAEPFDGVRADGEAALGRRRRRPKWRDVVDTRPAPHMDVDVYSTKKTVSQGFMDVALLSANADQLRTLVTKGDADSPFHTVCIVFLSLSLILQVVIAVCLLFKGRANINKSKHFRGCEVANNICMVASVLLTVCNVLASAFMSEVPASAGGAAGAAAASLGAVLG